MFYYTILSIFATLIANSNGKQQTSLANAPKPCCLPKQHTSQMSISSGMVVPDGKSYSLYSVYNFTYDSDRNLVALKGEQISIDDGQKTHWWVIENMKDGQTYTIDLDSKRCYKSAITVKPLYCIPDTAVYQYSSAYGYGDKQIIGDTWLIIEDAAIRYFTVSNDGQCIPIHGNSYSTNPACVNSTTIANFIPRILDPSVFDIPEQCKNASKHLDFSP